MSAIQLQQEMKIAPGGMTGDLTVPEHALGMVVFAHGSGSSRHSPRNRYVAGVLQQKGFATLLLDLLTEAEEQVDAQSGALRFDIGMLAGRLVEATDWLAREPAVSDLPVGYFGASTGAGAALAAAAERPGIKAVVSRGGRPDLAGAALSKVRSPALLIAGGRDYTVIELNRQAMDRMSGEKQLVVVPDATHLFEEPGALEEVARLAAGWFAKHLRP